MKAVQVSKPGGRFELVDRPLPTPPRDWVRIKVQACGVCHSDLYTKEGVWPGIQFPRVAGHEVAGIVDALGENVTTWKPGDRVGIGWYGGHCGVCNPCRRGDLMNCINLRITGITHDGGYQEYMIAPAQSLAAMPDRLSPEEAAPLLCAGITTYNALRHSGATPGDLVAIQAIGGLGHLAIQYAAKFGYRVAAIGRGKEARDLALRLGAHLYFSSEDKPAEQLQKLGGAKAILSTAPSGKAMSEMIDGLSANGTLMVVGASTDPIEVSPVQLIRGMRTIRGWASGVAADSEDALRFSELSGVRPMIEKFPLAKAAQAYDRMISGKARFRVVLTM